MLIGLYVRSEAIEKDNSRFKDCSLAKELINV